MGTTYRQSSFGSVSDETLIKNILENDEAIPDASIRGAVYRNRRVYIRTDGKLEINGMFLNLWAFLNVRVNLYTDSREVKGGLEVTADNRPILKIRPYTGGYVVISESEKIWAYPGTVVLRAYARRLNSCLSSD
jgi:hypothetical protein